jgi:alpha-beta hydrolase superfamily lysophospholipase
LANVRSDSNAARDGLKAGDVVLKANGADAKATSEFVRPLLRRAAGDKVEFVVRRDGQEARATVEYRAAPMEHASGLEVQYRAVETDGHLRRVLVTVPKKPGRHPAILWISGSGCGSQEVPAGGNPLVGFLYEMTRRGYVTMRVEKTGAGDSEGPPCYSESGGFAQEVRGYVAGLADLRAYDFVDASHIYVFGHSAGATLAPLVIKDQKVRGIMVAGAMGTNFLDYLLAMRQREQELAGKKRDEVTAQVATTRKCVERLLNDRLSPDVVEQENPDCRRRVRFDSPPPYIQDWHDLGLAKAWAAAPDVPVQVLYGSGDFVTSEAESRALVATINQAHPKSATLKILPMDHGFLAFATAQEAWNGEQGKAKADLLPALADEVESFLHKH